MKSNEIKKTILYVFASIGMVLFIITIYTVLNDNKSNIDFSTILEIMGSCIVLSIILTLSQKIESRYAIIAILIDIGPMIAGIIIFEMLFNWRKYVPIWLPVTTVIAVYLLFYVLDIIRIRKDIDEINDLLKKKKEKDAHTAS